MNQGKKKMKYFFSIIIIIVFTLSCNNERQEPNFYRNLHTGKILNKSEFEKFRFIQDKNYISDFDKEILRIKKSDN